MDHTSEQPFEFSKAKLESLKEKYSQEMRDRDDNPIKVCMKLVFEAAIEKDPSRRLELSNELSIFLTKPDGVVNLFLALIDFDVSSQKVTSHNQRFISVSKIIACLPKLSMPFKEYYLNISKQLKPLILHEEAKYSTLACIIMQSMIGSPRAREEEIAAVVLGPLIESFSVAGDFYKLSDAIISVHTLLQNHLSVDHFVCIFPHLFYSLLVLESTPSKLKPTLRTILISIMTDLKPAVACCLIEKTLLHDRTRFQTVYTAVAGDDGTTIEIKSNAERAHPPEHLPEDQSSIDLILSLLQDSKSELLVLEFFFHFMEIMWVTPDEDSRRFGANLIEPMLIETAEEREELTKFDLLSIIATNSHQSLDLILRSLLNYITFLRSDREEFAQKQKLVQQSIISCISIIEVLLATPGNTESIRTNGYPILCQLRDLLASKNRQNGDLFVSVDSLVKRLEDELSRQTPFNNLEPSNQAVELEFSSIMKDLNDKLEPVRVHAIVKLKQMVLANNPHVTSRIPQLYLLIVGSLADPEPYVFLASINLLVEMTIRKTSEILPKLMAIYSDCELDVQQRMNAGEVLVRVTRQLNETTPFYAQQVLNTLIRSCKDDEELMRMSSLTNIGEICRNLGNNLGRYIVEILYCIQEVLVNDVIEVKCAAIDLLRTTLMGLSRLTVEPIQREIRVIYNILKSVKCKTIDDKLCLQVDLALDELDRLARELLIGETHDGDLVKNIKVLQLL